MIADWILRPCRRASRLALCLVCALLPAGVQGVDVLSPDGNYRVTIDGLTYRISYRGETIVGDGRLGVDVDNRLHESALGVPHSNNSWMDDLTLRDEERAVCDTTWRPLYGENGIVRDHYNQLTLHYVKGGERLGTADGGYDKRQSYALDVIVRAYDEGVAMRYHFPETSNGLFLHLTGERTSFPMPEGTLAWHEEWAQGPYAKKALSEPWTDCERPLLLQLPGGTYVALLEAAQRDFPRGKFKLACENELQVSLYGGMDIIPPYDTPWRVVMAGERAVDLINHKDLVGCLNEPSEAEKDDASGREAYSWVRPGRAFRSCRLDKESIFRSIDFCQAFGIEYVELDAGWYGPEGRSDSDATTVSPTRDFTIEEVCAYAREKGVGVWLYVNQRALSRQLDELLPLYRRWGISGLKFGFVQVGSAQWTEWLHEAVRRCGEHGLMVDIHDEYRPTGLSRTFPWLLTQEGVRGNEEMPDATHDVTLPFTRYLCGPADYTLCYADKRVKNTRAHQLALAAVYYSPLQFLFWYDAPFPAGWDEAGLEFWRQCPTTFDESLALDGVPGEYIVQARRTGSDWLVGALTNTEARTITLKTDFLPKGRYTVTLYTDDLSSSSTSASRIHVETLKLKAGKTLTLPLLPSGGVAIHFAKIKR